MKTLTSPRCLSPLRARGIPRGSLGCHSPQALTSSSLGLHMDWNQTQSIDEFTHPQSLGCHNPQWLTSSSLGLHMDWNQTQSIDIITHPQSLNCHNPQGMTSSSLGLHMDLNQTQSIERICTSIQGMSATRHTFQVHNRIYHKGPEVHHLCTVTCISGVDKMVPRHNESGTSTTVFRCRDKGD